MWRILFFMISRKMHRKFRHFVLCVLFVKNKSLSSSQKVTTESTSSQHVEQQQIMDASINCLDDYMAYDGQLARKRKLIFLLDIETEDGIHRKNNTAWSNRDNLFFIESSGRNHLWQREACAIESAVKNSRIQGRIIIAMTSPSIDVLANNATCQIYTKFAERQIFFRYVNIDTIFRRTPFHELHVKGHLKHCDEKSTVVQYRYN